MSADAGMAFLKFPKIYENSGDIKIPKRIEWIGTEKIDGSNFSVYSNGNQVKFAKRTGFLKDDEWFFSYQKISIDLIKKAQKLYKILSQKVPKLNYIVIYGELCGGYFPEDPKTWTGPVPTRVNEKGKIVIPLEKRAIQESVYYCDKIQLIVFDIAVVTNTRRYLEFDEMVEMCKSVGLFFTPPLVTGTLAKLLDFSLDFDSTIPSMFGLPILKNNTAEGIVIRPKMWPDDDRPMIKRKNKKFRQISGEFDESMTETNPFVLATRLMNQNRLDGTISKVGPRAPFDEIQREFVEDVWNSMWEYKVQVTDYDSVDLFIKEECAKLINGYQTSL